MTSFLINPYRFGALWTFANTTTTAWYDAADAATVTTVSGVVSQITDKSGNGYTLTQATAGARPTYDLATVNGLNVLSFDGGDTLQAASAANWKFLSDTTGSTIFIVTRVDLSAAAVLMSTGIVSSSSIAHILYAETSNRIEAIVYRGTAGACFDNLSNADDFARSTLHVVSSLSDPGNATAANRSAISVNGNTSIKRNTLNNAASASSPAGPLTLGGTTSSTLRFTGLICELAIISGLASQNIIDKGTGYLAHKWGTTSSLPAGHPYKSIAPTA
jgi:hypothetical protein